MHRNFIDLNFTWEFIFQSEWIITLWHNDNEPNVSLCASYFDSIHWSPSIISTHWSNSRNWISQLLYKWKSRGQSIQRHFIQRYRLSISDTTKRTNIEWIQFADYWKTNRGLGWTLWLVFKPSELSHKVFKEMSLKLCVNVHFICRMR